MENRKARCYRPTTGRCPASPCEPFSHLSTRRPRGIGEPMSKNLISFPIAKELNPKLTPGTYGLNLFLSEPTPKKELAKVQSRLNSPKVKLDSLDLMSGAYLGQVQALLNSPSPAVREAVRQNAESLRACLDEFLGTREAALAGVTA